MLITEPHRLGEVVKGIELSNPRTLPRKNQMLFLGLKPSVRSSTQRWHLFPTMFSTLLKIDWSHIYIVIWKCSQFGKIYNCWIHRCKARALQRLAQGHCHMTNTTSRVAQRLPDNRSRFYTLEHTVLYLSLRKRDFESIVVKGVTKYW